MFSGDIGNSRQPIIRDPAYLCEADYVITESTYGDREHREGEGEYTEDLARILDGTFAKGGNVIRNIRESNESFSLGKGYKSKLGKSVKRFLMGFALPTVHIKRACLKIEYEY